MALRFAADVELARSVVVVLGSAVTLGWLVVPVLFAGVDQTLDPVRFATFAVPRRQLLAGMLAAALVGIPGVGPVRAGADHDGHLVARRPWPWSSRSGGRGRRADLRRR